MRDREQFKKLVFILLEGKELKAREVYEEIRHNYPNIIHEERIRGFHSFVKIINSIKEIKKKGCKGEPLNYFIH